MTVTPEELKKKLDEAGYIYDDTLITTLVVSLALGRPLLIEGAAGVGKTEVAKVMAYALGRELVRLQCYEGLDESKSIYEWNYQKQLLSIQVGMGQSQPQSKTELTKSVFSEEYLLERPLLKSIRSEKPVVLLIDEIDKADEEFEAFLLEMLSELQLTIPEIGTVKAKSTPFVVLTSNRTGPLSEPNVSDRLALAVAQAVHDLRENDNIMKKPSIAETLDWIAALEALGAPDLTPEAAGLTAGFILKNEEDIAQLDTGCSCGHHHH